MLKFQKYLARDQITQIIFDFTNFGNGIGKPLFDGRSVITERGDIVRYVINILNKAYARLSDHGCKHKCSACYRKPPCSSRMNLQDQLETKKCDDCLRSFVNINCFNHYIFPDSCSKGKSICNVLKICTGCTKLINFLKNKDHQCGFTYCRVCKTAREYNHECFIQPVKNEKPTDPVIIIFYDLETQLRLQ